MHPQKSIKEYTLGMQKVWVKDRLDLKEVCEQLLVTTYFLFIVPL